MSIGADASCDLARVQFLPRNADEESQDVAGNASTTEDCDAHRATSCHNRGQIDYACGSTDHGGWARAQKLLEPNSRSPQANSRLVVQLIAKFGRRAAFSSHAQEAGVSGTLALQFRTCQNHQGIRADVAQPVEQRFRKPPVGSSSLPVGSEISERKRIDRARVTG